MKRLVCLILIIAILISGLAFVRVDVHATAVGGAITTNTEWTINDSPIVFSGSVTVAANATLTIDAGVTVNFGAYSSLTVAGTLTAIGTPDNPITFTIPENRTVGVHIFLQNFGSGNSTPPASVFQYVNFNKVYVYSGSSTEIDNCNFSSAMPQTVITVNEGSPTITNNRIVFTGQDSSHYSYGISVSSGTPIIANNEFEGNGQFTAINDQSANSFEISNNLFSNCWIGVKAEAKVILTVQGNTFERCNDGLDINAVASLTIRNNLIDNCIRYGINGGGFIDSNTIANNHVGIHNPNAGSIISNNNIVANTINSVTAASLPVNAQNNWWGITDEPTIRQSIYDVHIDRSLGEVSFVPFLTGPSPYAPAIPVNTPLTTIAPTVQPTEKPIQPTIAHTEAPSTIAPSPTPTRKSLTILNDTSDLLNINLIVTSVLSLMILVWIAVILGYIVKGGVNRFKEENKA